MLCLTGCGMMSLTTKESDMIAEYAAYVLVNTTFSVMAVHNRFYNRKPYSTSSIFSSSSFIYLIKLNPHFSSKSMAEAMEVEGFDISYTNYELVKEYKDDYFTMRTSFVSFAAKVSFRELKSFSNIVS